MANPSKKFLITNIAIIFVCLDCFEPFTRLRLFSPLQNNELNSFPRTFWSNTHNFFGISIKFSLLCCGYSKDAMVLSYYFQELNEFSLLYHLSSSNVLFQIKVYYRRSAFADMKKNCSFSGERKTHQPWFLFHWVKAAIIASWEINVEDLHCNETYRHTNI